MIGNQAIARGLVEAGVELAAAYPGTPSSEILPGIVEFKRLEKKDIHTEWSTNEKCAFEVAFGAASIGKKAACFMKQVGLNVAFASLLKAMEKPIDGGLVIVSCDDPGPQSSQTEQDTRLVASLYGITVFDPASPKEAADVAFYALNYSFKHKKPVIIRSTHRVSHAREAVPLYPPGTRTVVLNEGLQPSDSLSSSPSCSSLHAPCPMPHAVPNSLFTIHRPLGVVASGMSYSLAYDVIHDLGIEHFVPIFKVLTVYPPDKKLLDFVKTVAKVLVLEETDQVIEAMLGDREKVLGRASGHVPGAGEITYDIVRDVIARIVTELGIADIGFSPDKSIEETLRDLNIQPRPPKLCAGCPHRASFFAMRHVFPEAIFPGDIGCYTLGTAQGAVDTFLDMGSGVSFAAGFYDAFNQDAKLIPILASVGDSTFFHACLPLLYDAVQKEKKFILVIMDNGTTAMTGMQPTPQTGVTVDNITTRSVKIEDIVKGFGVSFLRIIDPYDVPLMVGTIREAFDYLKQDKSTPAVIIARRECTLLSKSGLKDALESIDIEKDCTGCKICVKYFNCPALPFDEETKRVQIDKGLCVRCGICLYACPVQEKGKRLKSQKTKNEEGRGKREAGKREGAGQGR
jgi:indolepyruvate ferredoxin oxidoreductase alpha subunit